MWYDPAIYEPLPDDRHIAITDVVELRPRRSGPGAMRTSTLPAPPRSSPSATPWGTFDFPFVFRGDGAAFALPPEAAATAASTLRQVAAFASDSLGLTLRTGLLSVREVRANGSDVRIARYAASQERHLYHVCRWRY
ncbi:DUF3095 family protein [Ensifer canadensis]